MNCLSETIGLALTHTIAKAMVQGLCTSKKPFLRTPKCEKRSAVVRGLMMAREELAILGLLWLAAGAVIGRYGAENPDIVTWAVILIVQSAPYLAALCLSLLSVMPNLVPGVSRALGLGNAGRLGKLAAAGSVSASSGVAAVRIPVGKQSQDNK